MATVPVPLRDRPKISQYSMSSGQTSLLFFNVVNKNQLFGFRVRLHYNTDPDPNPSQASFGSGSLQIKGSKKKQEKISRRFPIGKYVTNGIGELKFKIKEQKQNV